MSLNYLYVEARTWNHESHGLFDYDTKQLTLQNFKLTTSGSLLRKGNEISFLTEDSSPTSGLLVKILAADNHYIIYPGKEERMSLVVKKITSKPKKLYKLSKGDVIKLGKVKLKVKFIQNESQNESCGDEYEGSNNGDVCCRICFRTHTNKIDPLVSVCKCSGSMELVHVACAQQYMHSKAVKKPRVNCTSYLWRSIQCDVCKENLPHTVSYEDRHYELFTIPKESNSKCIVLEDFRRHKYKCILHVIYASEAPTLIGRSTDTDLKVNEISVSRNHATIELIDNDFHIKDHNSKFGTTISQKRPLHLDKSYPLSLQIGRSQLTFSIKTHSKVLSCFSSCCRKSNKVAQMPKSRTEIVWEEESLRSVENNED